MGEILIVSAKLVTLGLLKTKIFWNEFITFVLDVTNKPLPLESNYIVDVAMWTTFGNSSISLKEVIITSVLYGFDKTDH